MKSWNSAVEFQTVAGKLKWIAPRRAFGIAAVVSAQVADDFDMAPKANGDETAPAVATTPAAAPRNPRRSSVRPSCSEGVSALILSSFGGLRDELLSERCKTVVRLYPDP
jgi:hypothetical protein